MIFLVSFCKTKQTKKEKPKPEIKEEFVFDEAENRLHAQKAIMHFCVK